MMFQKMCYFDLVAMVTAKNWLKTVTNVTQKQNAAF